MSESTEKQGWAQYFPDYDDRGAPNLFIQWKGTDLCADFRCSCGNGAHICGESFVYAIKCSHCGKVWMTPHTVQLVEVPPGYTGCVTEPVDGLDLSVLREYEKAERTCDRCGVTSRDVHVYHWCVPIDGPSPGCANWCAECAHKES